MSTKGQAIPFADNPEHELVSGYPFPPLRVQVQASSDLRLLRQGRFSLSPRLWGGMPSFGVALATPRSSVGATKVPAASWPVPLLLLGLVARRSSSGLWVGLVCH